MRSDPNKKLGVERENFQAAVDYKNNLVTRPDTFRSVLLAPASSPPSPRPVLDRRVPQATLDNFRPCLFNFLLDFKQTNFPKHLDPYRSDSERGASRS